MDSVKAVRLQCVQDVAAWIRSRLRSQASALFGGIPPSRPPDAAAAGHVPGAFAGTKQNNSEPSLGVNSSP